MRLIIAAAGRWKAAPERALFDHFAGRVAFPLELREIEEKKKLKPAALKKREGERLLGQVPDGAVVVALDETGKTLNSVAVAEKLKGWRDDGVRDVAFLVGGAGGLWLFLLRRRIRAGESAPAPLSEDERKQVESLSRDDPL